MIALDTKADTIDIIPDCDSALPAAEQTVFVARPLTIYEEAKLADLAIYDQGELHMNQGQRYVETLNYALVGVKNLKDKKNRDIKIERGINGKLSDEFLARVPWGVWQDVAAQIIMSNRLTQDEVKN